MGLWGSDRGFDGVLRGFLGVPWVNGGADRGFGGVYGQKWRVWWKNGGFSKNGVFVGFWSRNRGKVGKSREFDDFLKIGENREK